MFIIFFDFYFLFSNSGLLLNSILTSFRPEFVANRSLLFVQILSTSTTEGITKSQLFRSFGIVLNNIPPAVEHRQEVLKNVWNVIATFTDSTEYITCVEVWSLYIAKYFGVSNYNICRNMYLY